MSVCFCGKEASQNTNYCNWECRVAQARAEGGKEIRPNGLPITCIRANWDMLESSYADHPGYLFPINVKYLGKLDPDDENFARYENHDVIGIVDGIVTTAYEACRCTWHGLTGGCFGGSLWKVGEYQIEPESLEKIKKYIKNNP